MPVWLRRFYLNEVNEARKAQDAANKKADTKGQIRPPSFSKNPPKR